MKASLAAKGMSQNLSGAKKAHIVLVYELQDKSTARSLELKLTLHEPLQDVSIIDKWNIYLFIFRFI